MTTRKLRNILLGFLFWAAFLGLVVITRSPVLAIAFGLCFGVAAVAGRIALARRRP